MRLRLFIAAVLISLSAATPGIAFNAVPRGATQAVAAYSRALMTADCDRLQGLSAVTRRHPEVTQPFCEIAHEWKRAGMMERLRAPTSSQASGLYRMVVIPNSRVMVSEHGPLVANGVYVAVSDDGGASWSVIDISCDKLTDWVKKEYPPYNGHPSFDEVGSVDFPKAERGR